MNRHLHIIASTLVILLSCEVLKAQGLFVSAGTTVTVNSAAELTALGTITSADGSTWVNKGIIRLSNNGSWIDQTTGPGYNYGTGKFIFTGTGSHLINSSNSFTRIDIDGSGLDMQSDIVSPKWYLKNGIVNTGSFLVVVTDPTIDAVEADPANNGFTNSWFNGRLQRAILPSTANQYIFPVGSNLHSNVAVLDNLSASPIMATGSVEVSFGAKPGNDAGLLVSEGGAYVAVNNSGVWFFTTSSPLNSSGRYDLSLFTNGFSGLQDNQFGILQRPVGSSNAADWTVPAGSSLPSGGSPGRKVASGFALRNNISTFGQFGIGMSSTPLPVTLANFNALRIDKTSVQLDWQTASEQNNKGFDVERRYDNETAFRTMGFVASKAAGGNSTMLLSYNYTDLNNYPGISYYRLKQTDLDDRSTYTLIKAVKGTGDQAVTVLLWPNPNKGQFSIRLSGNNQTLQAFITDMNGSIVQRLTIQQNRDVTVNGLVAGAYLIRIPDAFGKGESFSEKVLVVK